MDGAARAGPPGDGGHGARPDDAGIRSG